MVKGGVVHRLACLAKRCIYSKRVDVWILNLSCSIYYRWTSCCSVQVKTNLWPPGKGSELPTAPNHNFLLLSSSFRVEHKQSVSVSFTELYPCTLSTVLPPVGQKWSCIGAGNFQTICPVFKHHLAPY